MTGESPPSSPRERRHAVRGFGRLGALLVAALTTACSGGDSGDALPSDADRIESADLIQVRDAAGHIVRLNGPARRVVSLVPSATATLGEIGAQDRVIGRTDFDTSAWAMGLPSVGGGLEPNLETLVSLRPDLVVRFAGSQDRRTPARLDDLGIPHLAVRPDRVADILESIHLLGLATGFEAEADSLVQQIRRGLREVETRVRDLPRRRVAYVLGGTPPWVAGPGTYIAELLTLAGGDNVFSDLEELYAPISPEEIRSRDIELVLVSGVEAFDPGLAPEARVQVVEADIEIPGPRLVESAWRLAEMIHGPLGTSPPAHRGSGGQ